VRDFEEGRRQFPDLEGLPELERRRAQGVADAGGGEDLGPALAHQGADARGVVRVPVGQEHGANVVETPADTGEEGFDAPAREPGVYEQAASVRLYVRGVARATARKYA
jgi:hypothetical protein